ncbi:MAG: hypothetical protein RL223_3021 [Pseudomonadota bacterium]
MSGGRAGRLRGALQSGVLVWAAVVALAALAGAALAAPAAPPAAPAWPAPAAASAAAPLAPSTAILPAAPATARQASAPVWPLTLRDDRGHRLTLPRAPQRIVTLLPSLTETVCVLEACDRLVGTDRYSNWPAAIAALPRLGGLDDAQLERIVALKPDLVLASGSARAVERLEALGVPVLALEARTLADAQRVMRVVGRALGREAAAQAQVQRIQQRLQALAARVPAGWRGRKAYFEVSASPHAAGTASFIGELLAVLGVGNIVPPELGPFPQLSPEYVVRARPDLMLGSRRAVEAMAGRPGWAALPALRDGRFCGFDEAAYDTLVRPGPRLAEAAGHLQQCLQRLAPPAGGR